MIKLNKSICLLFLFGNSVMADSFTYPSNQGDRMIGSKPWQTQYTHAKRHDTLLDIARTYNLGQNEIVLTNPKVDRWLPGEGTKVIIPISRLLPDTPHTGLVLNLAEYRLYHYPKASTRATRTVTTHPISIGRVDWDTPLGDTRIIAKNKDPVWRPPKSIKAEHAAEGDILPDVFPAGPDNPLGQYAMRLGVPGYLIHGTNKPYGVGMRVSHGCIRMYPEDIEKLFSQVRVGLPVHIVNQAIKVGWSDDRLYIEVHPSLNEKERYHDQLEIALNLIEKANGNRMPVVNGKALKRALNNSNGIPVAISERHKTI